MEWKNNLSSEETKLKAEYLYERASLMYALLVSYILDEEVFLVLIFEYFKYTLDEKSHT